MRQLLPLVLIALAGVGCNAQLTPLQKATIADDTTTTLVGVLNTAYERKAITASAFLSAQPYVEAANAAVDELYAAAESGSADVYPSAFWHAYRAWERAYADLSAAKSAAERRKPKPATRPAVPGRVDPVPSPPPPPVPSPVVPDGPPPESFGVPG